MDWQRFNDQFAETPWERQERWRPIATAQKDLSQILLYSPNEGPVVAQFEHRAIDPHWNYDVFDIDPGGSHRIDDATHWMPLPDAPITGE